MEFCDVTFRLLQNTGALSTGLNHTTSQDSISLHLIYYISSLM